MNLRTIDVNLLVVLDALIEERSVSRASQRLGLSQSATSHALGRLRRLVGDELLVRRGVGMEPTPRALRLAGPLRLALQGMEDALAPERFEPGAADTAFTLAVETYETIVVLPQLVDLVRTDAPGVSLTIRSGSTEEILAGIDEGRIDLALGLFAGLPNRFMTCRLLRDTHACAMRADHPLATAPLSLDGYLAAPHLLVSMSHAATDVVDAVLARRGLRRRIAMRLPNGLAATLALARSDMVATVTRGAARTFAGAAPLAVLDLPFAVPPAVFRLAWNRRFHGSPGHAWLRRRLVEVAAAAEAQPGG